MMLAISCCDNSNLGAERVHDYGMMVLFPFAPTRDIGMLDWARLTSRTARRPDMITDVC